MAHPVALRLLKCPRAQEVCQLGRSHGPWALAGRRGYRTGLSGPSVTYSCMSMWHVQLATHQYLNLI